MTGERESIWQLPKGLPPFPVTHNKFPAEQYEKVVPSDEIWTQRFGGPMTHDQLEVMMSALNVLNELAEENDVHLSAYEDLRLIGDGWGVSLAYNETQKIYEVLTI